MHRPDCQIVLIGRVGEGDPATALDELICHANIHLLGPRDYAVLPDYLRGFDLALLPCPINHYTRSMFPMKFFEYLAAGVPVVSTNLPALQDHANLARICAGQVAFLEAVDALLLEKQRGLCAAVPLDQLPASCSYRSRTGSMMQLLDQLLSAPTTA
jgi:glycosyltransferase involved in cell wall biosynthesis